MALYFFDHIKKGGVVMWIIFLDNNFNAIVNMNDRKAFGYCCTKTFEMYRAESQTDAIRRNLLLKAGILN